MGGILWWSVTMNYINCSRLGPTLSFWERHHPWLDILRQYPWDAGRWWAGLEKLCLAVYASGSQLSQLDRVPQITSRWHALGWYVRCLLASAHGTRLWLWVSLPSSVINGATWELEVSCGTSIYTIGISSSYTSGPFSLKKLVMGHYHHLTFTCVGMYCKFKSKGLRMDTQIIAALKHTSTWG